MCGVQVLATRLPATAAPQVRACGRAGGVGAVRSPLITAEHAGCPSFPPPRAQEGMPLPSAITVSPAFAQCPNDAMTELLTFPVDFTANVGDGAARAVERGLARALDGAAFHAQSAAVLVLGAHPASTRAAVEGEPAAASQGA